MDDIEIKDIVDRIGITNAEIIEALSKCAIHIDESWEKLSIEIYKKLLDYLKSSNNNKAIFLNDKKRRKHIVLHASIQLIHLNKSSKISLNRFGLDEIPRAMFELTHLEFLDLSSNRIKRISPEIKKLKKLKYLILYGNKISELPEEIAALSNLKSLIVHNNKLKALPSSFGKLKKLQKLNLSRNLFEVFPDKVFELTALKELWLTYNKLEYVPDALLEFKKINPQFKSIFLFKNPLSKIPIYQWRKNKLKELLIYFDGLKEGDVTNYEVKLILLGKGGVGKTTLMARLKNPNAQIKDLIKIEQTDGIIIAPFYISVGSEMFKSNTETDDVDNENAKFKINMWDFGGQEIQRNIHQFFLTENALYILLWEVRSAENKYTYFKNWLNTIKAFGGKNSRVILVLNKVFDENEQEIISAKEVINQEELRRLFPQLTDFDEISALYNVGLEGPKGLKAKIRKHIKALPNVGEKLPRKWFRVKNRIESLKAGKNILSYKNYLAICNTEFNITKQEADLVSDWLHQIGVIIHYKEPKSLKPTMVHIPFQIDPPLPVKLTPAYR